MKYLIVANGPFLPKSMLLEASEDAKIVALDGAFRPLMHLGICPELVIGDFDSLTLPVGTNDIHPNRLLEKKSKYYLSLPEHRQISFIHQPDQNFTDLQKALQFCLREGATAIHIVCALGGRLDHNQAAICALSQAYTPLCPIYLHAVDQSAYIACNERIVIRGKPKDYCGLFGAPFGTMSVKNNGLAYGEAKPYALSSKQYSTSNYLVSDEAIVDITGNVLIIHPPMFQTQRVFSEKSRKEQLMELLHELDDEMDDEMGA